MNIESNDLVKKERQYTLSVKNGNKTTQIGTTEDRELGIILKPEF